MKEYKLRLNGNGGLPPEMKDTNFYVVLGSRLLKNGTNLVIDYSKDVDELYQKYNEDTGIYYIYKILGISTDSTDIYGSEVEEIQVPEVDGSDLQIGDVILPTDSDTHLVEVDITNNNDTEVTVEFIPTTENEGYTIKGSPGVLPPKSSKKIQLILTINSRDQVILVDSNLDLLVNGTVQAKDHLSGKLIPEGLSHQDEDESDNPEIPTKLQEYFTNPPTLSDEDEEREVVANSSASFSVNVGLTDKVQDPKYHWYVANQDMEEVVSHPVTDSSEFTIESVPDGYNGYYVYCRVEVVSDSDEALSMTSNVVKLIVTNEDDHEDEDSEDSQDDEVEDDPDDGDAEDQVQTDEGETEDEVTKVEFTEGLPSTIQGELDSTQSVSIKIKSNDYDKVSYSWTILNQDSESVVKTIDESETSDGDEGTKIVTIDLLMTDDIDEKILKVEVTYTDPDSEDQTISSKSDISIS